MGSILNNPPVFHMLIQIKFNRITAIKNYYDQIQECFRQASFPDAKENLQQEISIQQPTEDTMQNVRIEHKNQLTWHFMNFERSAGFVLGDDFLVYHTTAYKCFNDALPHILNGINIIHEVMAISFIERIGMRFLNAILPEPSKQLSDYLIPDVLGFSGTSLETNGYIKQHSMFESILFSEAEKRVCASRIVMAKTNNSPPIMPQDLIPLIQQLDLQKQFIGLTGDMALLDIDCFQDGMREQFVLNQIEKHITALHDNASTIFRTLIRPERMQQWEV